MLKYFCEALFWGGIGFNSILFGVHFWAVNSNRELFQMLRKTTVDEIAEAYGEGKTSVEPWVLIPLAFVAGVLMWAAGVYLEVSIFGWFLFSVSYIGTNMTKFKYYYLPAWETGEEIRSKKRWDRVFKALDSMDDINKKRSKDRI